MNQKLDSDDWCSLFNSEYQDEVYSQFIMKSTVNIVIIAVSIMMKFIVSIKIKFTVSIKKLTVNIMIIAVKFHDEVYCQYQDEVYSQYQEVNSQYHDHSSYALVIFNHVPRGPGNSGDIDFSI